MKFFIFPVALITFWLALASAAWAETLQTEESVSVHVRPDSDSPVIGEIHPGEPIESPDERVVLGPEQERAGWRAVSFEGEIEGFVQRRSLTKDLEVRRGSLIYLDRDTSSDSVITEAEAGDTINVGHLSGDWADVRVYKMVSGFLRYREARPETGAPEEREDGEIANIELDDEPRAQPLPDSGPPISSRSAIPTDGSLRLFQGYLSEPHSFLGRSHPFPYQVVNERGNRIAYLDLSRLLITTPIENILNYRFDFYGRAEKIDGQRDFVIRVENMRTR